MRQLVLLETEGTLVEVQQLVQLETEVTREVREVARQSGKADVAVVDTDVDVAVVGAPDIVVVVDIVGWMHEKLR